MRHKYHTIEGDLIVRDGEYETRGGRKAVVLGFIPENNDDLCPPPIVGYIRDGEEVHSVVKWFKSGHQSPQFNDGADYPENTREDLMRYYESLEKPKKRTLPSSYKRMVDLYKKSQEPSPEAKVYKLSEMWKVWFIPHMRPAKICQAEYYKTKEEALVETKEYNRLAITPADATEFFEGQGLEELITKPEVS